MRSRWAFSTTAETLALQHNSALDDGAGLALWDPFRGEGSTFAPATDNSTSPPRTLETDGANMPLHTPELHPSSPDTDMAPCAKSPLEEVNRVQQPPLIDGCKRNSASPTLIESPPTG